MRLKLKLAQGDKDTSRKLLITIKVIFDACMCFVLKCSLHWVLSQYYWLPLRLTPCTRTSRFRLGYLRQRDNFRGCRTQSFLGRPTWEQFGWGENLSRWPEIDRAFIFQIFQKWLRQAIPKILPRPRIRSCRSLYLAVFIHMYLIKIECISTVYRWYHLLLSIRRLVEYQVTISYYWEKRGGK